MTLTWDDLTIREREIMAIKYGVSCHGEMNATSPEELDKIPETAYLAMEEKRALKKELDEIKAKILEPKEVKEEPKKKPMKKYTKAKTVKKVKKK